MEELRRRQPTTADTKDTLVTLHKEATAACSKQKQRGPVYVLKVGLLCVRLQQTVERSGGYDMLHSLAFPVHPG